MNNPNYDVPHCRCDFVHRWLDAHEKYFPKHTRIPKPTTSSIHPTYQLQPAPSTTQQNLYEYQYRPLPVVMKNGQMMQMLQAPHRISPMKPVPH